MKSESRQPELPKLPHGDGVLVYTSNGKILYRKSIPVDGDYRRLAVTGRTLKECFDAMQKKESEIQAGLQSASNQPLAVAIDEWLRLYKQPEVKPSSYGRLCITFDSQIKRMAIAGKPWKKIKTDDLQQAINALIPCGYSWSTIKKAYDMLNAFYTFQTRRCYLPRNPMELCRMPVRENLLKQEKEIVYMTEQQIQVFSKEALSYAYGSSKLKYRYGPAFVFLIYTGLRVGELCALQWKDFDLGKRTVSITKNLMEIYNRDYGTGYEKVAQYTTKISTTKTRSTRIVPLNQKALMAYKLMWQAAPYTKQMIMCSVRHAGTLLHRARWKGGLHIYFNQQGLIYRPVAVICCAIPVQVCCSLRNCKWRLSPVYWATARKCAVEPTYISVRNSVRRPYSRLQSLTTFRCVHRENIL